MLVNDLNLLTKAKIRLLGQVDVNGKRALGYCIHHGYFQSLIHLNDEARCPECDKIFVNRLKEEWKWKDT